MQTTLSSGQLTKAGLTSHDNSPAETSMVVTTVAAAGIRLIVGDNGGDHEYFMQANETKMFEIENHHQPMSAAGHHHYQAKHDRQLHLMRGSSSSTGAINRIGLLNHQPEDGREQLFMEQPHLLSPHSANFLLARHQKPHRNKHKHDHKFARDPLHHEALLHTTPSESKRSILHQVVHSITKSHSWTHLHLLGGGGERKRQLESPVSQEGVVDQSVSSHSAIGKGHFFGRRSRNNSTSSAAGFSAEDHSDANSSLDFKPVRRCSATPEAFAGVDVIEKSYRAVACTPKLAEILATMTEERGGRGHSINRGLFVELVFGQARMLADKIFDHLVQSCESERDARELHKTEAVYEKHLVKGLVPFTRPALDAPSIGLYLSLFAGGAEAGRGSNATMTDISFREFLHCCYISATGYGNSDSLLICPKTEVFGDAFCSNNEQPNEVCSKNEQPNQEDARTGTGSGDDNSKGCSSAVVQSVLASAFHRKTEKSMGYLQSWILRNCPRLILPLSTIVSESILNAHSRLCPSSNHEEPPTSYPHEDELEQEKSHMPVIVMRGSLSHNSADICHLQVRAAPAAAEEEVIPREELWILSASLPGVYLEPQPIVNKGKMASDPTYEDLGCPSISNVCVRRGGDTSAGSRSLSTTQKLLAGAMEPGPRRHSAIDLGNLLANSLLVQSLSSSNAAAAGQLSSSTHSLFTKNKSKHQGEKRSSKPTIKFVVGGDKGVLPDEVDTQDSTLTGNTHVKESPLQRHAEWQLMYDSGRHGKKMAILFDRIKDCRMPTVMFIFAEDDYTLCIGADTPWRDGGSFWGGEDAIALLISPEYRIVTTGAKILCFNVSIDGFTKGFFVGEDTRNPIIKVGGTLFDTVEYRQIPLSIRRIVVLSVTEGQPPSPAEPSSGKRHNKSTSLPNKTSNSTPPRPTRGIISISSELRNSFAPDQLNEERRSIDGGIRKLGSELGINQHD